VRKVGIYGVGDWWAGVYFGLLVQFDNWLQYKVIRPAAKRWRAAEDRRTLIRSGWAARPIKKELPAADR
jgi:hypothetical protein